MSALGQKQTFALHQPMSALPPKAGLEIAIHFATDSSLAQTLNYLGSDAPPVKLAPLLSV
jgi:hypothetical protein